MNRFARFALSVTAAAITLSGCTTLEQSVPTPSPIATKQQDVISPREQKLTSYVFSAERRDKLEQAYNSVIWKPIDLMLDGMISYEIEGSIGTEEETGHIAHDPETFEVIRLPVTPDGWAIISSTLPRGESWHGIKRITANVKLRNNEVDRSVTPDQIDVLFEDDTSLWMNARVIHFGDSQTPIHDSWVSLWYSSTFLENTAVDIRQRCDSEKGCSRSSSPFMGHEDEFRIEVNGSLKASVEDAMAADARFIEAISKWNKDGSNWRG